MFASRSDLSERSCVPHAAAVAPLSRQAAESSFATVKNLRPSLRVEVVRKTRATGLYGTTGAGGAILATPLGRDFRITSAGGEKMQGYVPADDKPSDLRRCDLRHRGESRIGAASPFAFVGSEPVSHPPELASHHEGRELQIPARFADDVGTRPGGGSAASAQSIRSVRKRAGEPCFA